MFVLSGMSFRHKSTWLFPSLFSGLWPQSLYLRGLSSLNSHPFITLYFLALLPVSSHIYYLALYHVLIFYVFAVCGIPVCVTLLEAPLLHIIPPGPRAAAAAAAHDVCWMYEFKPGPSSYNTSVELWLRVWKTEQNKTHSKYFSCPKMTMRWLSFGQSPKAR